MCVGVGEHMHVLCMTLSSVLILTVGHDSKAKCVCVCVCVYNHTHSVAAATVCPSWPPDDCVCRGGQVFALQNSKMSISGGLIACSYKIEFWTITKCSVLS